MKTRHVVLLAFLLIIQTIVAIALETPLFYTAFSTLTPVMVFYWVTRMESEVVTEAETSKELSESEDRNRLLSELAFEGIVVHQNNVIVEVNKSALSLFGYASVEEVKNIGNLFFFVADECIPSLKRYVDEGYEGVYEITARRKDGGLFPAEVNVRNCLYRGTRARVASVRDITDRKNALELLKKQGEFLRTILDTIPTPIFYKNIRGIYLGCNTAFEKFIGRSREEVVGRTTEEIYPPEMARVFRDKDSQLHRNSGTQVFEHKFIHSDGTLHDVIIQKTLFYDSDNRVAGIIGTLSDITERKQAELEIKWNAKVDSCLSGLYKPLISPYLTIEEMADAVLSVCIQLTDSSHGFVSSINLEDGDNVVHTFTRMIEDECEINDAEDGKIAFHPDRNRLYPGLWGHALNEREPFFTNEPQNHPSSTGMPSGHVSLKNFLSVPVILGSDLVGQIALANSERDYVQKDVLAVGKAAELYALAISRKHINDELKRAKDVAETANRMKSDFLANMSHELRTPMNAIMGMGELIAATALNGEQREYLDVLNNSSQILLTLLNDLLDFAKIEEGDMSVSEIPFDIRNLLLGIRKSFQAYASEKGLELKLRLDADVPGMIKGDPTLFRQIIVHLLSNAIKFTPRGSVEISASRACELTPDEKKRREVLIFCVRDTGIGISGDKLGMIFDSFVQIDGSVSRLYGGTGLGLALVNKLIRLMNGKIWVESRPDKGSAFYFIIDFILPETDDNQHFEEISVSEQQPDFRGLKILIAEDNAINKMLMEKYVHDLGCTTASAENGAEVLKILGRERFDLVLMDVRMPVLDGTETTRRIRNGEYPGVDPHIPIIAISAHVMPGDREHFLDAGMNDYLSKPMRSSELKQVMSRVLEKNGRTMNPPASAAPPDDLQPSADGD